MNDHINVELSDRIAIISIENPPLNIFSHSVRKGIFDELTKIKDSTDVDAIVIYGVGRSFMAGGDINEFAPPGVLFPHPNEVHATLDFLSIPVVAALHGDVLGAGLELALSCDYRVSDETARFGFPEVKLGLIPGGGGTQRFPRVVGLKTALDMMTTGRVISAIEARESGVVDELVEKDVKEKAVQLARKIVNACEPRRILSKKTLDDNQSDSLDITEYKSKLPKKEKGGQAAHEIVNCVEAVLTKTFDEGLSIERRSFDTLCQSEESIARRHVFFAEKEAGKIPGLEPGQGLRTINLVGVVGSGTMGVGIALSFANVGIPVVITDLKQESIDRGLQTAKNIYDAAIKKGQLTSEAAEKRLSLIQTTLNDEELSKCDLVIEAAFENMEVKKAVCARLGSICKQGAIIASNTSSLDINLLAEVSGRAEDFLGMHFFSPAHIMKLLEVVRGDKTSPQVLATVMNLSKKIQKVAVVSGVCFGFIGNRMLEGYLREAEFLLLEGATPRQIDEAMEEFGMPMGPCRMIDMAGVDVGAKIVIEQIKTNNDLTDPAYRVVVRRLNDMGRHGQKTGSGYYKYDGRKAIDDLSVIEICKELAKEYGVVQRSNISKVEILERCMYPLVNEGWRILKEGIAYRSGDVDTVWVNGYGFPAYRGGPMFWAEAVGKESIVNSMNGYAEKFGNKFGYWSVA